MCLKSWSLTCLRFTFKWALRLFGGSSRGVQLLVHHGSSSTGEHVLFHRAQGNREGRIRGVMREERDTHLPARSAESSLAIDGVTDVADRPHIRKLRERRVLICRLKAMRMSVMVAKCVVFSSLQQHKSLPIIHCKHLNSTPTFK